MSKIFETGWDPYIHLLQAESNIEQLAIAYNEHRILIDELRSLATHQQEIIQELVQHNNRLSQISARQVKQIHQINLEIDLIKHPQV